MKYVDSSVPKAQPEKAISVTGRFGVGLDRSPAFEASRASTDFPSERENVDTLTRFIFRTEMAARRTVILQTIEHQTSWERKSVWR